MIILYTIHICEISILYRYVYLFGKRHDRNNGYSLIKMRKILKLIHIDPYSLILYHFLDQEWVNYYQEDLNRTSWREPILIWWIVWTWSTYSPSWSNGLITIKRYAKFLPTYYTWLIYSASFVSEKGEKKQYPPVIKVTEYFEWSTGSKWPVHFSFMKRRLWTGKLSLLVIQIMVFDPSLQTRTISWRKFNSEPSNHVLNLYTICRVNCAMYIIILVR